MCSQDVARYVVIVRVRQPGVCHYVGEHARVSFDRLRAGRDGQPVIATYRFLAAPFPEWANMFDLSQVPRDPAVAVEYLLRYLAEYEHLWWPNGSTIDPAQVGEFNDILEITRVAVRSSDLSPEIRLHLLKSLDTAEGRGIGWFRAVITTFRRLERQEEITQHFNGLSGASDVTFKLEKGDIKRIAGLAAEMKDIVNVSDFFDKDHKKRLIDRISQVEIEVHKSKGKFDVILGGIVDFGDALGKFGKRVKPLFDRMQQIRSIAQKRTAEYEKLTPPDEVKLLPPPEEAPTPVTNGAEAPDEARPQTEVAPRIGNSGSKKPRKRRAPVG